MATAGATQSALAALPSHGGHRARQSDRLVEFTAKARATVLSASAPRPARNAVTPLPHIPWRSRPYVAFLVCRIERENSSAASVYAAASRPVLPIFAPLRRAGLLFTSLQDRNLNAVEIGWPFRLGLQGCIVDRSQDIGWQRTFGHGRKIVPELLQRSCINPCSTRRDRWPAFIARFLGGPSAAPRRSESVRRCERFLAYHNNSFSRSNSM